MRYLLLLCSLVGIALGGSDIVGTATAPIPPGVDVERAQALIAAWENDHPERAERVLRVVYWTPSDRQPAPQYRERLTRVMRYVQDFYATQMASYGLGRRSMHLEMAADGLLNLRVATGAHPFADYRRESGQDIRRDCAAVLAKDGIRADDETLVIFCNLSTWDADHRTMKQTSPYYAGGDHRKGNAWQVDSPLLDPDLIPDKTSMITDGEYGHISVGRYDSIFVGGVAHELGHALGLPHSSQAPSEHATRGTSLMGSGNRTMGEQTRGEGPGTFLSLPDALRLLTHVQFSGSVKGMAMPAEVAWNGLSVRAGDQGAAIVTGQVTGKIPVYAVLVYGDPTGHDDYDAQIGCAVPDASGAFQVIVPAPQVAYTTTGQFRLVACCVNGAKTANSGADGKPLIPFGLDGGHFTAEPSTTYLGILSVLAAARAGTPSDEIRQHLPPQAQDILTRLLKPASSATHPEPADIPLSVTAIPLSDTHPQSASTGYGGVHYDCQPPNDPLLSGDKLFAHGIFAHVDAKHTYRLGGSWTTVTGTCGIGSDGHGPAEFIISGDGKELWRSGTVKPGMLVQFTVPVNAVGVLELDTKQTPAGPAGAWALWLEPLLKR